MIEFDVPRVESIWGTPRDRGQRRFVLVTMPDGDPFDLIGAMAVLREANFILNASGRPDLVYDYEVVSNQPGTVFEIDGFKMVVDKSCYDVRGNLDTVVFEAIDYEGKMFAGRALHRVGPARFEAGAAHGHGVHRKLCAG